MDSKATPLFSTILRDFTLRMADHGFSVSSTLMMCEPGYALEQLRCAHALADTRLRAMAMEVFRQLELRDPAIACLAEAL